MRRRVAAIDLLAGDRITASGVAYEGKVVAEVSEQVMPVRGPVREEDCYMRVSFTDGTSMELDGPDAPVTIYR